MRIGKTKGKILYHQYNPDYIWTSDTYSNLLWTFTLQGDTFLTPKYSVYFSRYFNNLT